MTENAEDAEAQDIQSCNWIVYYIRGLKKRTWKVRLAGWLHIDNVSENIPNKQTHSAKVPGSTLAAVFWMCTTHDKFVHSRYVCKSMTEVTNYSHWREDDRRHIFTDLISSNFIFSSNPNIYFFLPQHHCQSEQFSYCLEWKLFVVPPGKAKDVYDVNSADDISDVYVPPAHKWVDACLFQCNDREQFKFFQKLYACLAILKCHLAPRTSSIKKVFFGLSLPSAALWNLK